jgi:NAD(P)-dependent dehydrogenase (short-subunit alcohol dehydrogenase family)
MSNGNGTLEDRVAIVTGGSRGLGQAIAWAFADEGADIAVVGRDETKLMETVGGIEERGRKALGLTAELRDVSKISDVFDQAEKVLGESTILVNSAGLQGDRPTLEVTEEQYDEVVDTNLKALYFCCQEAGRRWIDRGTKGNIINLGSIFAVVGMENFSVYCATKGAVLLLTKTLTIEWAKHGINVNAIGPVATMTDMVAPLFEDPEFKAAYMPKVPSGDLPEPSDIGRAAVFLAGPDSKMIHGHHLLVDSGYTIN